MVTHYGVIYDAKTLAPRRVIATDKVGSLLDGTHKADPGEMFCMVERAHVEHLIPDLGEMAREAIRRHSGKEPPTMERVYAMDRKP